MADSLALLILKLDVEVISLCVDAAIEVLVVICEFLLLILLHPLVDLVLFVLGFASVGLLGFVASGFRDEGASFQRGEDVLAGGRDVEAVNWGCHFVLICEFKGIGTVNLKVLVEGRCHESGSAADHFHSAHCLLVVAG